MSIEKKHTVGIYLEINKQKPCFSKKYECYENKEHFSNTWSLCVSTNVSISWFNIMASSVFKPFLLKFKPLPKSLIIVAFG